MYEFFGTGVTLAAAGGMALAALGMVLTPGPNMMYLVSRSISQGRGAGLVSLIGTGCGFVVYMTMANLGLAAVFVVVPWLYIGLKGCGVLYLGWLAWKALRPGGQGVFEIQDVRHNTQWALFRMGLITNLLNPKTAVMYLALIPQFINAADGPTITQGFTLGGIQITISMIVNGAIIMAAGTIARFLSVRPSWTRWQRRATGSMLGLVTIALARDVPQHATA